MATRNIAAVDLGASSGRVLLARFDGQKLSMEELHRFTNRPVTVRGHRFWNILGLWDNTLSGLSKARQVTGTLDSIGVDTRAIDYGLVDTHGFLLGQPFQYRDARTNRCSQGNSPMPIASSLFPTCCTVGSAEHWSANAPMRRRRSVGTLELPPGQWISSSNWRFPRHYSRRSSRRVPCWAKFYRHCKVNWVRLV